LNSFNSKNFNSFDSLTILTEQLTEEFSFLRFILLARVCEFHCYVPFPRICKLFNYFCSSSFVSLLSRPVQKFWLQKYQHFEQVYIRNNVQNIIIIVIFLFCFVRFWSILFLKHLIHFNLWAGTVDLKNSIQNAFFVGLWPFCSQTYSAMDGNDGRNRQVDFCSSI
jgi:hypothetical protein